MYTAEASPHPLEIASWIGGLILVFVGVGSFIAAALALIEAARARRASLLLQLDERFDSTEMKDARALLYTKLDEVKHAVATAQPLANEAQRNTLCRTEWAARLGDMRVNDNGNYMKLLVFAGFFETVGLMVNMRYISSTDVINLLEGPILDMEMAFREHVANRITESGTAPDLLKHAFLLADVAKKKAAQRAA